MLWNGQKTGGLSLRVKRDERVGGLVVGWSGCDVLSHFFPLSNPLLIDNCHIFAVCTMSRVCVGLVGVCCMMSSDGVWGVDDAVCVSLSTPKKAAQHTVLFACDGVHQCTVLYGVVS